MNSCKCLGGIGRSALFVWQLIAVFVLAALFGVPSFAEVRLLDVGVYYGRMSPEWTELSADDAFYMLISPHASDKIGKTEAVGRDGERSAKFMLSELAGNPVFSVRLIPNCGYYVVLERFDLNAFGVRADGSYDVSVMESRLAAYRNSGLAAVWCYDYSPAIVVPGFESYDAALAFVNEHGGSPESGDSLFTVQSRVSGEIVAIMSASNKDAAVCTSVSKMACSSAQDVHGYRGGFRYTLGSAGYFSLVNRVAVEDYLLGVVPVEMSSSYPIEALKAQAVAARNYAAYPSGKFAKYGFDLDDSVASQAYYGYDFEKQSATEAVQATAGEYMLYDGELIQMFFAASSGGYTDSVSNVWGGKDLPYLSAKPDPYSVGYRWKYVLTPDFMSEVVAELGEYIGEPSGIEILERTESGRVKRMRLIGTAGSFFVSGERFKDVVNMKAFKSTLFSFDSANSETIFADAPVPKSGGTDEKPIVKLSEISGIMVSSDPPNLSRSGSVQTDNENVQTNLAENYTLRLTAPESAYFNTGEIAVYGHGYGHGIGLSQLGAVKMAELGKTYTEILEFYYTKVESVKK